jgi:hypothetical protein
MIDRNYTAAGLGLVAAVTSRPFTKGAWQSKSKAAGTAVAILYNGEKMNDMKKVTSPRQVPS